MVHLISLTYSKRILFCFGLKGCFWGKKNPKCWEKSAVHKTVHKATPTQTHRSSGLPAAKALGMGG